MQVDEKPKQYPEFQKRIPIYGIPVEEEVPKPEEKKTSATEMGRLPRFGVPVVETPAASKQMVTLKEKPKFTRVSWQSLFSKLCLLRIPSWHYDLLHV